jgi:type I restriction enzyme R subunit
MAGREARPTKQPPMDTLVRHRRLPHWDVPGATYFITSCLADSIPAKGLLDIASFRHALDNRERPGEMAPELWRYHRDKLTFGRTDRWLDSDPAVRHLADRRLAQVVVDAMFHFAGERYDLLAYVVMPSHIHWVFQPTEAWVRTLGPTCESRTPRERIMHSLKTRTARACNHLLALSGAFWQGESYDHWVRDEDELYRIIASVEQNPVKAGLVADPDGWAFSSARLRAQFGIPFGEAIPRARLAL